MVEDGGSSGVGSGVGVKIEKIMGLMDFLKHWFWPGVNGMWCRGRQTVLATLLKSPRDVEIGQLTVRHGFKFQFQKNFSPY
jgi:hypothetical protein